MAIRSIAFILVLLAVPAASYSETKEKVEDSRASLREKTEKNLARVALVGVRHTISGRRTRVVLELRGGVTYSEHRLTNPDRLYFDLEGAYLPEGFNGVHTVNSSSVGNVRIAQHAKNVVRCVLELGRAERFEAVSVENKLVVDVFSDTEEEEGSHRSWFTIVLDPGHGGEDPGAIGPGGIMEKDVVLDVAKRLRQQLSSRKDVRVVLTRNEDVFVPLLDRTKIANREEADLFLSIHVNAVPGRKRSEVRGIETYLLNWSNTKEAQRVAERENRILVRAGDQKPDLSVLDVIFSDLSRDYKRDESLRLAHAVQNTVVGDLKREYTEIRDLGVKQGRFYVLIGATMPAVLAEISFITHPAESRRLAKSSYRESIAGGLSRAVMSYLAPPTLARR